MTIKMQRSDNMIIRWEDRPVVSLTEATMITGLSASTLKRRIYSGVLSAVERNSLHEKLLIHTKSLVKYLEEVN